MNEVERVALWVGLIASVAGIVLSLVAIWFARNVDRAAREVNNQTIRSLETITSTVTRLSDDTQTLIKGAWDKLVVGATGVGPAPSELSSSQDSAQIAAGLTAEVEADLKDTAEGGRRGPDEVAAVLDELQRSVSALLRAAPEPGSAAAQIDALRVRLNALSPATLEFARALSAGRHLTRAQYQRLHRSQDAARLIAELREQGLLVPLRGHTADEEIVYWFPVGMRRFLGPAFMLHAAEYPEEHERAQELLRAVGYPARNADPRPRTGVTQPVKGRRASSPDDAADTLR